MNIRKKLDRSKCCVTRCRKSPAYVHSDPAAEYELWFCERHAVHAQTEYQEIGITPEVLDLRFPNEGPGAEPASRGERFAGTEATSASREPGPSSGTGEILSPAQVEQIQKDRALATETLTELEGFEIHTTGEAAFAETELASVQAQWKSYEGQRTAATQPLNKGLQVVNGWFKPVQGALKALEAAWKRALNEHRFRAAEEQKRALEAAQEASAQLEFRVAEKANNLAEQGATAVEIETAKQTVKTEAHEEIRGAMVQAAEATVKTEKAVYIDRWLFEVTEPGAVPREYLCPDEKKIKAVVASLGENCMIPGVRVWNDPIVRGPPVKKH